MRKPVPFYAAAPRQGGFTLIEVMITVGIVAILASLALPSYTAYIQRGRVPAALDALGSFYTRMEQRYQDTGNYGTTACSLIPAAATNFTLSCTLTDSGQGFTATATGSGSMANYEYTITHRGARATTAHPKGGNNNCWTTRGNSCDT
jgi:type IV pilus assembly protein PilE